MSNSKSYASILMGSESLLVRCAGILMAEGHIIGAIISNNKDILAWADQNSIVGIRPSKDLSKDVENIEFDYFFSITNFRIVPDTVLNRAREIAINFHDGPLPAYAGLNVPSWALMNGEKQHGITWHEMSAGIDEGSILEQVTFDIDPTDTAFDLNAKCYEAAASSFETLVRDLAAGTVTRIEQDFSTRQYFARDKRPMAGGFLDWTHPTRRILDVVRALDYGSYDNPLGFPKMVYGANLVLPTKASDASDESSATVEGGKPGQILSLTKASLVVATGDGSIEFSNVLNEYGQPILDTAEFGFRVGESFQIADANEIASLDDQVTISAKRERKWTSSFRKMERLDFPFESDDSVASQSDRVFSYSDLSTNFHLEDTIGLAAIFLAKMAGQASANVMYGVDVSGIQKSIFSDAVPVQISIDSNSSIRETIDTVQESIADSLDSGPFQKDLPLRDSTLRPSADSLFPRILITDSERSDSTLDSFDLAVMLDESRGSLKWSFRAGRGSQAVADAMAARFEAAVAFVAGKDGSPCSDLPLVTEKEAQHLIVELNNTETSYQDDACLNELIEAQVQKTPDAPALTYRGQSISYSEMDARANKIAHRLRQLGVGPDTFVGLCTDRSHSLVISALAVWKAGGAYVPLDPDFPLDRLEHMVLDSGLEIIITQSKLRTNLPKSGATIVNLDEDSTIDGMPSSKPDQISSSKNLAYTIYTSGSTGKPKGVLVEHRNVSNFFTGMDNVIDVQESRKWLAVTSLSFDISVLELFWTLCRGFEVVLFEGISSEKESSGKSKIDAPMAFSLFYFSSDESERPGDKYRLLIEGAKFADNNGFYGVWTPERHFHAFGGLYPNPSVTSAALSTITENVRLFAGSCVSPLHHSIRVTEEWSVVDNLSNGRVAIAFASGWQPNDFILQPQNFADKKNVMFRQIEEVQSLWAGNTLTFENPEGREIQVRTLPRPVQETLPVWITTAGNPETFRMAGERGYNILTHMLGQTAKDVTDSIAIYREARKAAGHEGPGIVSLMLHTFVGTDSAAVKELVREPMKQYLRSSLGLIKDAAWSFPTFRSKTTDNSGRFTMDNLSKEDEDSVMELSFERYYESAGMFGTVDECIATVDRLKTIGVDDIACLIDFGVDSQTVLDSLPLLKTVLDGSNSIDNQATDTLASLMGTHNVSHFQCTPSMARMLLSDSEGRAAAEKLDHMMVGGEAFPPNLAKDLTDVVGGKVTNMYGPTETTIWSSTFTVDEILNPMPIGRPVANTSLYILDTSHNLVPKGVPGELYIGGAGVTRGYHQRDELTSERFVADPFNTSLRMYKTGDLCKYLPDGRIQFLGRNDFQVKIRGYRIELGEIESVLETYPGIKETVVAIREDLPGDQRITAYIVTDPLLDIEIEALLSHAGKSLPDYMVPVDTVVLKALPLTPNKKVDRKALPAPKRSRGISSSADLAKPENDLENNIVDIWKTALGIDSISVTDNFFDLGGHSLLAVQVNDKLKQLLSRDISLVDLFRYPTIRTLSGYLSTKDREPADAAKVAGTSRADERRKAMMRRRRSKSDGS